MYEPNSEGMPPKKEVSGIWVLLIFVALLVTIPILAMMVL